MDLEPADIDPKDRAFISAAACKLEHPGRVVQVLNNVGKPTEMILKRLPAWITRRIDRAVQRTLLDAMDWAVKSLDASVTIADRDVSALSKMVVSARGAMHVAAAAILGGVGGAFGLVALPLELPVTTLIILRSIAAIARDLGADLDDPATRLECITVLGLGNPTSKEEAMESSYLTTRLGLAILIRDASGFMVGKSAFQVSEALARGSAPEMLRLVSNIATRFGCAAIDLAYAEMVPILGAVGGAALNGYFTNFFNQIARYHFGIRRLERIYGEQVIQDIYRSELHRLA